MSSSASCVNCSADVEEVSELLTEVCSYDWKVTYHEWNKLLDDFKDAVSSMFPSDPTRNYCKWRLLWTCDFISSDVNHKSIKKTPSYAICLKLCTVIKDTIVIKYSISCITDSDYKISAHNCRLEMNSPKEFRVLGLSPKLLREPPVIRANISIFYELPVTQCDHVSDANFLNDIYTLFAHGQWSDISIIVEDQEIKTHKIILSTRSSVFAAMLKERDENSISITEFSYDIMSKIIQFMYSNIVNIEGYQEAKTLLEVSNRYGMDRLKTFVSAYLASRISENNALLLFYDADTYNCEHLKSSIGSFIVNNPKRFESEDTYGILLNRSDLLTEVMSYICKSIRCLNELSEE